MADPIYTAEATVVGGRTEGHGTSSDGELDVQLRAPGEGGGYAACFEGALGVVSRRARVDPGAVSIDSQVSLSANGEGGFGISVALNVSLPDVSDEATAVKLVADAHAVCPYSNATRGNIEVALTANGVAVS
jgi:osmotically inducible protein OsmC